MQDPTLRAYFAVLGFDEVNANQIFHLLDDDESGEAWQGLWAGRPEPQVSIEEFLEGCSKLKGHARSIDVHALMRQCRRAHRDSLEQLPMIGLQELKGVSMHFKGFEGDLGLLLPSSNRISL